MLSLFDIDGELLDENDDYEGANDGASRIIWQAPEDGLYYVRVTNKNGPGCGTHYDFWMESYHEPPPALIYLPLVMRKTGG